jgi:hypothetical protein
MAMVNIFFPDPLSQHMHLTQAFLPAGAVRPPAASSSPSLRIPVAQQLADPAIPARGQAPTVPARGQGPAAGQAHLLAPPHLPTVQLAGCRRRFSWQSPSPSSADETKTELTSPPPRHEGHQLDAPVAVVELTREGCLGGAHNLGGSRRRPSGAQRSFLRWEFVAGVIEAAPLGTKITWFVVLARAPHGCELEFWGVGKEQHVGGPAPSVTAVAGVRHAGTVELGLCFFFERMRRRET